LAHGSVRKKPMHSDKQVDHPTEEELCEADRNGVLRWKEKQDVLHIRTPPPGCVCDLCKTVRSIIKEQTAGKSSHASAMRRLDLLLKMRKSAD
jgi:hypothetical protein